ncbi:ankyrin repeat domain-containing protein [Ascidiimonas sp. W6]|uniref:ankyrin repeat domain-containing protein n=1 Tax=Ascidiimonas meishanensis TaxID=3128903 RepID=UPI0030EE1E69
MKLIIDADSRIDKNLIKALEQGNVSNVQTLLDSGANPNMVDRSRGGRTLLMAIAGVSPRDLNLKVVTSLLDHGGVNIHAASEDGWTAMDTAVNNGNYHLGKVLSERGANFDRIGRSSGMLDFQEAQQYLLKVGLPVNIGEDIIEKAIKHALINQDIEVASNIVEAGYDVDSRFHFRDPFFNDFVDHMRSKKELEKLLKPLNSSRIPDLSLKVIENVAVKHFEINPVKFVDPMHSKKEAKGFLKPLNGLLKVIKDVAVKHFKSNPVRKANRPNR